MINKFYGCFVYCFLFVKATFSGMNGLIIHSRQFFSLQSEAPCNFTLVIEEENN